MEDRPAAQSFPNLHPHRHRSSFPLSFPSAEVGYSPSLPAQDALRQYGGRGADSAFLQTSASPGPRRGSSGSDRVFLTSCGLDGDHFGADGRLVCHYDDSWYSKKSFWDDGGSCDGTPGELDGKADCYSGPNDVFCALNAEEGERCRIRASYDSYEHVSCESRGEAAYDRDAHHLTRRSRGAAQQCLAGEEDYGSSCGSGEEQLKPTDAEAPWLSISPTAGSEVTGQPEGSWTSQRSPVGVNSRTFTQKLDSFSEAFLSQRRRRCQTGPGAESSGQIWENGVGGGDAPGFLRARQSCAFDSEPCLPPSSSSPSFHSPPTSSHLMSSVLSPPPTPLPPPSNSPSKMDSPVHSALQMGEPLQFFQSRVQPLPSVHSSGITWKLPPQLPCEAGDSERSLRSSQGDNSGNTPASCGILPSPDSSSSLSLTSSSHRPSNHPPFHLPFHPFSGKHHEESVSPFKATQKIKLEAVSLEQPCSQEKEPSVYTGRLFPSILHSKRAQTRRHYTPQPLLNPSRRSTGLHWSLPPLHLEDEESLHGTEDETQEELPRINVGPDFQADIPPCIVDVGLFYEEDSPRDELLWKPWDELQENPQIYNQVEKLLSVCSSSCLPGGGSNTELALHCLHSSKGNAMATLEMLLFTQPSLTGNYHYSGSDFWTDAEKSLFNVAHGMYRKDFSLIGKMVRTKSVSQCVEFYYLNKKLVDKQKKQKEMECREREEELKKSMAAISHPLQRQLPPEEAVPVAPLASFFPCKLCGKMFYKIKSRNAHMKIHRQPQEDWADRRLRHQLLTKHLALTHPTNVLPQQPPPLAFPSASNAVADGVHSVVSNGNAVLEQGTAVTYCGQNSHVFNMNNLDAGNSNRKETAGVLPFHQAWGSFGHIPDLAAFYCVPEPKEGLGAGEGKDTGSWQ